MNKEEYFEDPVFINSFHAAMPAALRKLLSIKYQDWVQHAEDVVGDILHAEEIVLEALLKLMEIRRNMNQWTDIKVYVSKTITSLCDAALKLEMAAGVPIVYSRYKDNPKNVELVAAGQYMNQLNYRHRQIYILVQVHHQDPTKIAELLGIDIKTAKRYFKEAKNILEHFISPAK